MRKLVEANERAKRDYVTYLEEAKGLDQSSTGKVLDAILRFEQSTGFKPFKAFHIEQAIKFKADLGKARNAKTGKPLSAATVDATLANVRAFFLWLAGQRSYRSRIAYADAEYFRNKMKAARAAHADRERPCPSLEAAFHAFDAMPEGTIFEQRDKALFAFLMLTGARVGAAASIRLKHINLVEGRVLQDGREMNTKGAKTFETWFFPVRREYRDCFTRWVERLRREYLFGPEDAAFPKPEMERTVGGFAVKGLLRDPYSSGAKLNGIVRAAFAATQLPKYTPHSFRTMLAQFGDRICATMEERKAWSMNLGHEHLATTVSAYLPVPRQRRAEVMRDVAQRLAAAGD